MAQDPESSDTQRALHQIAGGRYELCAEIGQGGMATVYRARDGQLKRQVAIKVLHRHLIRKDEHRQRFRREAEAVARLRHPGIVEVYDLIEIPGEFLAIVMELVEGPSYDVLIDRHGPLLPELASMLVLPVLEALGHAHEQGVIHRDLKPSNILFDEEAGSPRLTDFGIAHVIDDHTLTTTGSVMGSPAFMAPEMVDGGAVTTRTDIFSMGSILFLMTTGEGPFSGRNASELLRNIVEGKQKRADRIHRQVGKSFSQLLDGVLSRAPDERPQSARALGQELQKFLEDFHSAPGPTLKRWFNNPDEVAAEITEEIIKGLKIQARKAIDDNERHRAMAHLERLMSMAPSDPEASQLLDELQNWSPWWRRRPVVLLFVIAALSTVGFFQFRSSTDGAEPMRLAAVESTADLESPEFAAAIESTRHAVQYSLSLATASTEAALLAGQIAADVAALAGSEAPSSPPEPPLEVEVSLSETPSFGEPAISEPVADEEASDIAPIAPYDESPVQDSVAVPEPRRIRFRVIPAAATISIDGEDYDAMEAARGIELPYGQHSLVARGNCCETHRQILVVDDELDEDQRVVLHWKDGYIRVSTDREALIWIDDEPSPRSISVDEEALFPIAFGPADQVGNEREISVRVADRDDLQRSRRQVVRVRPATEIPVAITLDDQ